ncbi:hypothetical protein K438DRAFT_1753431 [Mycena galopus ATCC 62051]|nr:hypothetical protein K438DRAFT_1753431 [Mycena galopus ATCC 62051]
MKLLNVVNACLNLDSLTPSDDQQFNHIPQRILHNNKGNTSRGNVLVKNKVLGTDWELSARGTRDTRKPVSRLSEQTGLPSRQTGLQADWRAWAGDPTKIHAHAQTSPLAQAQARLASRKRHTRQWTLIW